MLNVKSLDKWLVYFAIALLVYMPLHVFIVQSVSLVTGGLEIWKAAKDVILFAFVPVLLLAAYQRRLYKERAFRTLFAVGGAYVVLHLLFLALDSTDDTFSAAVGTVFNTRLLAFFLLGYVLGVSSKASVYRKWLLTTAVLVSVFVAFLGIVQYFLPSDILSSVGYSIERGVRPWFFIDGKSDLPRSFSTLKDPNSFGGFLVLPLLSILYALISPHANRALFARPFRRLALIVLAAVLFLALFLSFSRGALISFMGGAAVLIGLSIRSQVVALLKRYWVVFVVVAVMGAGFATQVSDSYVVQNVIFHADESTELTSPNQLRIEFAQQAVEDISQQPLGHGPGSAGLVSIRNPQGVNLIENYFLQVFYEVGLAGGLLFFGFIGFVAFRLRAHIAQDPLCLLLLAALASHLMLNMFVLSWSNEAIASQFWLLLGLAFGSLAVARRSRQA